MKIYIARHGQTLWNIEHRMQGWQDSSLSSKGIDDAKKLSKSLEDVEFDLIFSSPLGRAMSTAEYIRGERDKEIILLDSFKEMNFGIWEGMYDYQVKENYPKEHYNFWKQPELYEPIEGESFPQLIERVNCGLKGLITLHGKESKNILLVTHTCVIKSILSLVKKYKVKEFWNPPFINATSLTVLKVDSETVKTILEADISHLNI